MIKYSITTGHPTPEEQAALEDALRRREKPDTLVKRVKSVWATPQLRKALPRKA